MNAELYEQIKKDFERDGYVFIPAFFNADQVTAVKWELERYITEVVPHMPANHVMYEDKANPATLKQMQDLQTHSAFFNNLMCGSELEKLAEAVLGEKVIGKNVEYFNKPPRIGKSTPPHQDAYYFNIKPTQAVTMWMALEDADEQNGCVGYLSGSHKKGMRPHGRTSTIGFSQSITDYGTPEDLASLRKFPAKPGDLLIHHAMTVHVAGPNITESKSRKALGLIYFGESVQPDLEAKEAYMKSLNAQSV
ncbi:phytanoyl-CoA dioxygenase family protein [Mucilaginibacter sp. CSA2-8R]|uniref:phytanoyl-CoA dioxygenase family protein n=1 Tax=Mucilaginibacter sp. CSA2-8R TaxID=3141542 RepID=UPI00315DE274